MYSWIILVVIAVVAVWYFNNNRKNIPSWGPQKEDPLDTLRRRFANGEISEQEYEERKAILEEDNV